MDRSDRSSEEGAPAARGHQRSAHPTGKAALLLIGVTLLLVALAVLSTF